MRLRQFLQISHPSNDSQMTIDTTGAGSASDTFIFPLTDMGGVSSIEILWGDGSSDIITSVGQTELTHVYSVGGIYNIIVIGDLGYLWTYNNGGDRDKQRNVANWGNTTIEQQQFRRAKNLTVSAIDIPALVVGVHIADFFDCDALPSIPNFGQWDLFSASTGWQSMFSGSAIYNQAPSDNQLNGITNLQSFYGNCTLFNQDLSKQDYSSATNMTNIAISTSFSTANYDLLIESWHDGVSVTGKQPVTGCPVGVGTTQYSSAVQAKYDALVTYGIVFTDGGVV